MKSQFDWERVLSKDTLDSLDEGSKKLLGLTSAPAKSIDEYYKEGVRRRELRKAKGIKTVYGIEIKDKKK